MRIWRHLLTTPYLSFIIVLSKCPLSLDAPDDERVVLVPVALVDVHPAAVGDEVRAAVVLQGRSKRWALGCVNSSQRNPGGGITQPMARRFDRPCTGWRGAGSRSGRRPVRRRASRSRRGSRGGGRWPCGRRGGR